MGPENAQILAQLSLLTKSIRSMGGGVEETPIGGYVNRLDRAEQYFQEDGKGYLLVGEELTDPKLYDTKAFPFENVMPTLNDDYYWSEGMSPSDINPGSTVVWTWCTNDSERIILGTTKSFSMSVDGVNWKTRQFQAIRSRTGENSDSLLYYIYSGMLINGSLYLIATSYARQSDTRLWKLDSDFNLATEVPNSTGVVKFIYTSGRYLAVGSNWVYDLTNANEAVRSTMYAAVRDLAYWKGEWWTVRANGLYRTTDLAVRGNVVNPATNIYCVGSREDQLLYVTPTAINYFTNPANTTPQVAMGPETLAMGSVEPSYMMTEANGKFLIRGNGSGKPVATVNSLIVYDPVAKTWMESFCPHGATWFVAYCMPLWYRGEWWWTGNRYVHNGYSKSPDLFQWSGDEIDARVMMTYQNTDLNSANAGVCSDGGLRNVFVCNRHLTYTVDGGVTYRTVLGPWKTAGYLVSYGNEFFFDAGEFFAFTPRGNWKTTDFVNWTELSNVAKMDFSADVTGYRITKLSNGVWVMHSSAASDTVAWFTSDRGATWAVCGSKGFESVWWDSKRSKYCFRDYNRIVRLTSALAVAGTATNSTYVLSVGSAPLLSYYDEPTDRVYFVTPGYNTIDSIEASQYTVNSPYTPKSYVGGDQWIDIAWNAEMTEIVRIGGFLYAISARICRCNRERPYLSAMRFNQDGTGTYTQIELPVEGFELTQSPMGATYPVGYRSSTQYWMKFTADDQVDPKKKRFFLSGYWFDLSLETPTITLAHSPQAAFRKLTKLTSFPKTWMTKFASDGKGTVATIYNSVLYVSRQGGEFRPEMTVGAQQIQYGLGLWVMSTYAPDKNWSASSSAQPVLIALTVSYSTDLVTWKNKIFRSVPSKYFVEFRVLNGRWCLMTIRSLFATGGTNPSGKIGAWMGDEHDSSIGNTFLVRDGELVDVGVMNTTSLNWVYRVRLDPVHGLIPGVEVYNLEGQDREYLIQQAGGVGNYNDSAFMSDVFYKYSRINAGGSAGDTYAVSHNRCFNTDATINRGSFFTEVSVVNYVVGQPIYNTTGYNIPDFGGQVHTHGPYARAHWGKHHYYFTSGQTGSNYAGMCLLLDYARQRFIWNTGLYFSVNTTDDGQIFIINGNGILFRGVPGVHAMPRKNNFNGYQYKRVL